MAKKKKGVLDDGHTCSDCDGFKVGEGKRGNCRTFPPPNVKRDDQCDAYPMVDGVSIGCLQHSDRQ